ncbi:hypothetical protein BCON_0083g00200 [Botryotinia convoluta]|uniref:Uncharacterized protein n=1 Tax=Botryotinia convoluta TaxID=54673 RepID=A0A4Z1I2V2_9HELO|nr:hypothetical protein BCON_0083g00200 [Botryotinia convoluta]
MASTPLILALEIIALKPHCTTWPEEVIKCISWYMHTNDQYQVPVKMRKRSKNSIVFDVTRLLLSKTTYDSKPWVVGYVRKRCHRLMKDLITTWYAQGYLTKTRNIFRKSSMFKDCWERAQEQLVCLKSDESNILGNEELFAKRKPGDIGPPDGNSKKVRQDMAVDDTTTINTYDRLDLVEDWINHNSVSNVHAEINPTHPITFQKSVMIDPELQQAVSNQRNNFSNPSGENGSVIDTNSENEWRVNERDELRSQPHEVFSGDELSPHSSKTITPKTLRTPVIYPALPQTPPSRMILNESSTRTARAHRNTNTTSSHEELHSISNSGSITSLPMEKIMTINTMLECFRSTAIIITPERGLWVMVPAGPVLDDFNFHTWYSQKFGLDESQGLRFHYMDSSLNPTSCPVDVGRSDRESTILKQHLFFDFVETFNHFKGKLRTYRIAVIPENMVRLSISCRKYPLENKEKLFKFYHECGHKTPIFSIPKPSNSQRRNQKISVSGTYYEQERRLESTSLLNVMEPSNSSPTGPPSHVSKFASSRIHGTKLGVQAPTLLPPINLPLRKLPPLGELETGRFINHYQLAGEPEIVVRVQKADGKFTGPLRNAPFGHGVKTQDFFTWFTLVANQPSTSIPDVLQICFKDAVPVVEYEIYRGDESQFTKMWRNILPQCRRTVAIMSPLSEFVIFIRALYWHAGSS